MNSSRKLPKKFKLDLPKQAGNLLVIVGPTGSGKTSAAIEIALAVDAEILCADSRTIYRGIDIGTAKPTASEMRGVRHYGLDIVNPNERFSAADFVAYAKGVMSDVWRRGKPLIIVGGSGMYIDALLFGYAFRTQLDDTEEIQSMDSVQLLAAAQERYPQEISQFDVKNTRRLRELLLRGPVSVSDRDSLKYIVKILGIAPESADLQIRLEKRVKKMLNQGIVQEALLIKKEFGGNCPALQSPGYAESLAWNETLDSSELLEDVIVRSHKRLVKKQMTWFRRNSHIEWFTDSNKLERAGISYLGRSTGTMNV